MNKAKWGLVGIGKLGQALLKQIEDCGLSVGVYHPDKEKIAAVQQKYPHSRSMTLEELPSLDFLILALPAQQIIPFITKLQSEDVNLQKPIIVNMATSILTVTLKQQNSNLNWMGMKFMGHAEDLFLYGNGLFITEENVNFPRESKMIIEFFSQFGKIAIDNENILENVNKVATFHAIRAAKELQTELLKAGLPTEYVNRAITAIAPQVMRSYSLGTLSHFGQMIAKQIDEGKQDSN